MHPDLTPGLDVALLVFWAFVLFFVGLLFYLRREDRREGYPLEDEFTGRVDTAGGPYHTASTKYFRLPFDRGTVSVPTKGREPVDIAARRIARFAGAPYEPTGNPLIDAVGPAAYAKRADRPDIDMEGKPRIIPISATTGYSVVRRDVDPRGLDVIAADGRSVGQVNDLWIDQADHLIRYLQVSIDGRQVLAPFTMAKVKRDRVIIDAITSAQWADAPGLAGADVITLLEEEKVQAYFGGGYLYATGERSEPLI